ncbi:B9 domain-containing protein 2 isoform X2 [Bombyx mori]|uniref:B9 domain-containing protein 2 n=1 Tax=Bombyx mori TaxID=7091 RepID=A0A8R1WMB4_BOMMO|nr:B9 domain-containing protein 2 isoform X2 [Bombyx mori]
MAELHILGEIQGTTYFPENYSLFCRYSFQAGCNWTVISGASEGQTVAAEPDELQSVAWSHSIDIHYLSRGIQGWPKLVLQVSCVDSIGRSWVVGYAHCNIPAVPGLHNLEIPSWIPAATTLTDRLKEYFIGGSHQLLNLDIISLGNDRFKLKTRSKGIIKLNVDIVLRNFSKFGVEYK